MRHFAAAGAVMLWLGASTAAHAVTAASPSVSDFSFESPALDASTYMYGASAPGFSSDPINGTPSGSGGAGVASDASAFGLSNAPDGNQVGFVQDDGSLHLQVNDLTPGLTYSFTFATALRSAELADVVDVNFVASDDLDPDLGSFTPASDAFTECDHRLVHSHLHVRHPYVHGNERGRGH